jgi:hypothetical protein
LRESVFQQTLEMSVKVMSQKMEGIIEVLAPEKGTANIHTDKENKPGLLFGEKTFKKLFSVTTG